MNMRRLRAIATVALAWSLCEISLASADSIRTDANIVTAIDISDSVDAEMLYLEIEGMARALRSPTVLQAIRRGRNGRIGFAVFAWSHGGGYPELVSWTLIASELDAARVSAEMAHWLLLADQAAGRQLAMPHHSGRLTDISEGINHATQLFLAAPYVTHRQVLNIIGNGEDNLGENPEHARARLLSFGGSINGVVLGKEPAVLDYYRRYVVGGPGAFYLFADDPNSITEILELKLRYDLNADLVSRMVQTALSFVRTHISAAAKRNVQPKAGFCDESTVGSFCPAKQRPAAALLGAARQSSRPAVVQHPHDRLALIEARH